MLWRNHILTTATLLLLLTACTTPAHDDTIRIGLSVPLTGPVSLYGQWAKQGAQLAVQHINEDGGINGRNVSLIIEDDQCNAQKGTTTVNKLINVDNVNKLFVYCGAVTPAVAPITQGKAITLSGSVRTKPLIGKHPHLFNMPPAVQQEMNTLAHHVTNDGVENVAIFHQSDHFGKTYNDKFTNAIERQNGSVVLSEQFNKYEQADLRTALTKAHQRGAEAIFTSFNPPNLANLIQQAHELGLNMSFYGPWLAQTQLVPEQVGPAANGLTYTYSFKPEDGTNQFVRDYTERYGETPEMNAAFTYDAIRILANVSTQCNDDLQCMIDATESIQDYNGASGTFSFTDKHTTTREVYIKQLINGTYHYIT